jgi:hypothetical protein
MSNVWEKAGVILGGLSLIAAIGAFATPEVRCFFDLPSESCSPISEQKPEATLTPTPTPTQPLLPIPTSTPPAPQISTSEVAIVFDPPSNVRQSPNGDFLCSIRERTTINIYGSTGDWYYTDICGTMGVIHSGQITFQPN